MRYIHSFIHPDLFCQIRELYLHMSVLSLVNSLDLPAVWAMWESTWDGVAKLERLDMLVVRLSDVKALSKHGQRTLLTPIAKCKARREFDVVLESDVLVERKGWPFELHDYVICYI